MPEFAADNGGGRGMSEEVQQGAGAAGDPIVITLALAGTGRLDLTPSEKSELARFSHV
jgi:hypothetical protein